MSHFYLRYRFRHLACPHKPFNSEELQGSLELGHLALHQEYEPRWVEPNGNQILPVFPEVRLPRSDHLPSGRPITRNYFGFPESRFWPTSALPTIRELARQSRKARCGDGSQQAGTLVRAVAAPFQFWLCGHHSVLSHLVDKATKPAPDSAARATHRVSDEQKKTTPSRSGMIALSHSCPKRLFRISTATHTQHRQDGAYS
jgi:hypothetical protein